MLDTAAREVVAGVDAEHPFGRPGRPLAERSPFRLAFTASLGVGLAYELLRAVEALRQVLILFAVAVVLAIGLEPAVAVLARRMRRGFAVLIVVFALLGFFAGFIAAAVPPLTAQARQLVHQAPTYLLRLEQHSRTLAHLDARYHLVAALRRRVAQGPGLGLSALGGVVGVGRVLLSATAATVTVLVLLVYLLANFPSLKRGGYRLIPRSRRARVGLITDEILAHVGGFVLADFLTSVLAGSAATLFLFIAGVPYPVALGLFVALADLVPLIGASIGAIVAAIVAFFTSVGVGIASIVFFVLYQQAENRLLPRLLARSVRISPLLTILSALAGGALFGAIGAGLAIPLAAGGQLLVAEVLLPRQDRH
ncbi:MAG: AI-2E family transporter [Mycobacteriales bacterium]